MFHLYWGKKQNSRTCHINFYTRFLLKKLFTLSRLNIKKKKRFDETGYSNIWINQDIPNSNWLISSIKLRLHDQFKQGWYSRIEQSPKALNYRIFKENFEFENYFRILEDKDIYTLCKFRTTNHKLPIETGRWNNIDRVNRICTNCDNIAIGDEYHYIMECEYFSNFRNRFIVTNLRERPNI